MNKWINTHTHLVTWLILVIVAVVARLSMGTPWVYVMDATFYGGLALIFHYTLTRSKP